MVVANYSEFFGINSSGVFISKGDRWTPSSRGIELFEFRTWDGNNRTSQPLVKTKAGFLSASIPFFMINPDTWEWTRLNTAGLSQKGVGYYVSKTPSGRLFFNGSGGIGTGCFTSTDNGNTWATVNFPNGPPSVVSHNSTLYFGSSRWVFSANEATPDTQTQIMVSGLPSSFSFWSNSSFFMLGKTLFMGGRENGNVVFYKVSITETNPVATKISGYSPGSTLEETGLGGFGNNLMIYSSTANQSITSVSRDLGATWTNYTIPHIVSTFFFTSSGYPAYSTTSGQVYISSDQGESWKEVKLGINANDAPKIRVVDTDPDGYLNVVADWKGLSRSTQPVITPPAPTELVAHSIEPLRVRLGWSDNSDNENYFRIERSEGDNQHYDSINWVTANSFSRVVQFYGVESEKTYYFRVVAVNRAGKSKYSNELRVTTPAYCASTIPSHRSWTLRTLNESGLGTRTQTNVSLIKRGLSYELRSLAGNSPSWNDVDPVLNTMFVNFSENCGAVNLVNDPVRSSYFGEAMGTWDQAANKITVKWGVNLAATNVKEYFKETTELTLNASDPAPTFSPLIRLAVFDATGIYISFRSSIPFAKQYILYRSTSLTGPWTNEVGRVNSDQSYFIDRLNLQQGTTYHYTAKAVNPTGEGPLQSSFTESIVFDKSYFAGKETAPPDDNINPVRAQPSFVDVNNDGRDELFQTITNTSQARSGFTYFNTNGTFTFKPFGDAGISNYSAKFADMNNDGNIDMVSRTIEISKNRSYLEVYYGDGAGNFTKVFSKQHSILATQLGLFDFNQDGYLDFSANIAQPKPFSDLTSYRLTVFVNNRDGSFSEVFPFDEEPGSTPTDLDFGDYDLDGDLDLIQGGSYSNGTVCYLIQRNNGDGTYTKVQVPALEPYNSLTSVGCQWLDLNSDGYLDIAMVFSTIDDASRAVFINDGTGNFSPGPALPTLSGLSTPLGLLSLDIENDGDLDLIINSSTFSSQTQFYLNEGGGMTLADGGLLGVSSFTKLGSVASDVNGDGFQDVFTASSGDPLFQFFTNSKFSSGNWLKIKLRGVKSNRSAIGARIQVIIGSKILQRQVTVSGNGYLVGQNSLLQHVGMGAAASATLRVIWPNGRAQVIRNVTANQTIEVVEETDPPVIVEFSPAKAATNVSSSTTLKLTLDGTQTLVPTKKIRLFAKSENTPNALITLNAGDGVVEGNVYTYTLTDRLPQGKLIGVEMEEGVFIDSFENPTPTVTGNSWTFTVGTGPLLTARLPLPNAANVPVNSTIELTFDRPITGVPGKKIKLMDGANKLFEEEVSALIVTGNKIVFDPAGDLPYLKSLQVLMDEAAIMDDKGNTFEGFADGQFVITTIIEPDKTVPVLVAQSDALSILNKGFAPVSISVTVTDNRAVDKVYFNYRKSNSKNFTAIELTASSLVANSWTGNVLNSYADEMGFEYFFSATDPSGNFGRLPIVPSECYQSRLMLSGGDQPVIQVVGGGTQDAWRIISIPFEMSTNQISEIFSSLGAAGSRTWRMLRYSANTSVSPVQESWLEYPNSFQTIERGQGYFINAVQQKDIPLSSPKTPINSQSNPFEISLVKGWNLIGNPYPVTVLWDDIRAFNSLNDKVGPIKIFTNGTYSNGNEILALRGGFVYANEPVNKLKITFQGQTVSDGRVGGTTWSEGEWLMPLTLRQGNQQNTIGGVGMHRQSYLTYDQMDDFNPPAIGEGLLFRFDHPEHFMRSFARDVVDLHDQFRWDFKVDASAKGTTEIVWDPNMFTVKGKQLFLVDIDQQIVIDMQKDSIYRFFAGYQNRFRIYFGSDLEKAVLPERILLAAPVPNPTSDQAQINFMLPKDIGFSEVRLEVVDMMGRTLSLLEKSSLPAGFYTRQWDSSGFSSGMYLIRLRVRHEGNEIVNSRLLLKN